MTSDLHSIASPSTCWSCDHRLLLLESMPSLYAPTCSLFCSTVCCVGCAFWEDSKVVRFGREYLAFVIRSGPDYSYERMPHFSCPITQVTQFTRCWRLRRGILKEGFSEDHGRSREETRNCMSIDHSPLAWNWTSYEGNYKSYKGSWSVFIYHISDSHYKQWPPPSVHCDWIGARWIPNGQITGTLVTETWRALEFHTITFFDR